MVTKTQAIKNFLTAMSKLDDGQRGKARPDLVSLYNHDMECQVNVAADGGERITSEYQGRKWSGFTDGVTTWKSLRIPYKAATNPEFTDTEIKFDLAAHVEAIGMTGWDWVHKVSRWVAYDFDDIATHGEANRRTLKADELQEIIRIASEVPWVTIRKSTSGSGLHLYVFLSDDRNVSDGVETANHTEHAALARAILGKLSATTGFDFSSTVDVCGSNMWVWHRKTGSGDGLSLIKQGEPLTSIPVNWRDHLNVINNKSRRILPKVIEDNKNQDIFAELCGQRTRTPLDEQHKALLTYLEESNALWWWDNDNWMLVTHTSHLKDAYHELGMRGFFDTISVGKEKGVDHNCFAFPMRDGAWSVRRYTIGVGEHASWDQDPNGWTKCYLNRIPTFDSACRSHEGIEDPAGGYIFRDGLAASEAAKLLGVSLNLPGRQLNRKTRIKQHKDGRLVVEVDYDSMDRGDEMTSWLQKNKLWIRIFNTRIPDPVEPEVSVYDDVVRHLVTNSGEDSGWVIKNADMGWKYEPLVHVRVALSSLGLNPKDTQMILGSSIFKCWTIVNKPFQEEYPGNREWNRNAAALRYKPTQNADKLVTNHWDLILNHVGASLDETLKDNAWAKANGIKKGADYLRCWIASLFQNPLAPLPYLFLYGPQNSGKSILHEALSLLMTKGYVKADQSLTNQSGHNGELAGAVLCVVEEVDIGHSKIASNRIKDWVTAREVSIHEKYQTPYHIPNSTHWIQCANEHTYCPVFPGDTRITICYVPDINPLDMIPKNRMITALEDEASDFLAQMYALDIPESNDRLAVPVITTNEKNVIQQMNQAPLEQFISEKTKPSPGYWIKFSEFFDQLQKWLDPEDLHRHTKIFVGKHIPPQYPKGRSTRDAQFYLGNIAWTDADDSEPRERYVLSGPYLVRKDDPGPSVGSPNDGRNQ